MRPGTYFTSISTSSPFSSVALRYLYLVFLAWYLRTSPATPFFLYAATHRSRVRLPYGHILAASTTLTSFCAMGNTHRSRSSKISFAILTISGCYPKTAICLCTLPFLLDFSVIYDILRGRLRQSCRDRSSKYKECNHEDVLDNLRNGGDCCTDNRHHSATGQPWRVFYQNSARHHRLH